MILMKLTRLGLSEQKPQLGRGSSENPTAGGLGHTKSSGENEQAQPSRQKPQVLSSTNGLLGSVKAIGYLLWTQVTSKRETNMVLEEPAHF